MKTFVWIPAVALTVALADRPAAQSYVCAWGRMAFDSRAVDTPCVKVAAVGYRTTTLHTDGRIYAQGDTGPYLWCVVPPPPPGRRYVDMSANGFGLGLLDDGTLVGWGTILGYSPSYGVIPIPPLPPGLRYTRMAAGEHGIAERSDGTFVAWGQNLHGECNLPAVPPGLLVERFAAGLHNSAFLYSDGTLVMWGANAYGQNNVPPLPIGVRYLDVALGPRHTLALRSDGEIVAFGDNASGQCNVPPLPPGVRYVTCAAGGLVDSAAGSFYSLAARSDGAIVGWGANGFGQCNPPPVPAGLRVVQLAAGGQHALALLSDRTLLRWGNQGNYPIGVPSRYPNGQPGSGVRFADASAGFLHSVIARSDGSCVAFGDNSVGQCNVPLLGPFDRAVKVQASYATSAALLADGRVFVWETNFGGQCNVPPLPPGLAYTDVILGIGHTVVLRSDGEALAFGFPDFGQTVLPSRPPGVVFVGGSVNYGKNFLVQSDGQIAVSGTHVHAVPPPPPPPGLRYVAVACGSSSPNLALLSDGTAVIWPSGLGPTWVPVPPLPFGVAYVEVSGQTHHFVLRRSDGQIAMCGHVGGTNAFLAMVPPLPPGASYVNVSSYNSYSLGRVGPTTTYVSFAPGCAGSRPATRLVPRDTPRIGRVLQVTLFDLPVHVAMLAMGFERTTPLSLAALGMPGCALHTSIDATAVLVGQQHQAQWTLPIPDLPSLVGLRFYHQALVLDPAAGNGFGAVVSDAAEGVVGYP